MHWMLAMCGLNTVKTAPLCNVGLFSFVLCLQGLQGLYGPVGFPGPEGPEGYPVCKLIYLFPLPQTDPCIYTFTFLFFCLINF